MITDYTEELKEMSDEAKQLVSINDRFDNEPEHVRSTRIMYGQLMDHHIMFRENVGRSFSGRQINMAITFLEQACEKAIKAFYNQEK